MYGNHINLLMSYLIAQDYLMQIQPALRAQINSLGMARAEATAMEEINGYLSKKYDTSAEFTDTSLYNINTIYQAYARVYINYPAYSATSVYSIGNYVVNGLYAYVCNTNITVAEVFNASHWTLIGSATTIYFAAYPQPLFNVYGCYKPGDKVFWKGSIYTCKIGTTVPSDFDMVQDIDYSNVGLNNVFPNDPVKGANYWTNNGPYTVAPNTLNSAAYSSAAAYALNSTVTFTDNNVYINIVAIPSPGEEWNQAHWALLWVLGDNRSQLMVTHMINIALYWAHYSIAPNNVPDDRRDAYGIAKEWGKSVRDGINSTPLPVRQPKKGQRILFDSNVKRGNNY